MENNGKTNNSKDKIIIFDLGGVVLEFDHTIACKKFSIFSKFSPVEVYIILFESKLIYNYDCGKISTDDFYKKVMESLKIDIPFELFKEFWCRIFWKDISMYNLIRELKDCGYKLFLLSNTNKLHFENIKEEFRIIKEFDDFFLSYEIGYRKPDKEIYLSILEKTGVEGSRFIYVDDKEEFVEVAEGLGFKGIVFENVEQLREEFEKNSVILGN